MHAIRMMFFLLLLFIYFSSDVYDAATDGHSTLLTDVGFCTLLSRLHISNLREDHGEKHSGSIL